MEPCTLSRLLLVLTTGPIFLLLGAVGMMSVSAAQRQPEVGEAPASTLRDYLGRAHLRGRFAGYAPHFRIAKADVSQGLDGNGEVWWILDGNVQVGLVDQSLDFAELVNSDPLHPDPSVPFPKIHHAPTQPGDRVTMAKSFLLPLPGAAPDPAQEDFRFDVTDAKVVLRQTEHWANGDWRTKTMTWKVDPDFGYVLHVEDEMHAAFYGNMEHTNFLARNTVDDRPAFRRYTYLLWEHASGQIKRWNQNNMAACLPSNGDITGEKHMKTGGFIGYFGEEDHSSVIELLESSPDTWFATCPNVLDEHLTWMPSNPADAKRDAEGRCINRAVYNLVSAPPEISEMLTPRATLQDIYMGGAPPEIGYWGFSQGVPTDFETKLDLAAYHRGVQFMYGEDTNKEISVVSDDGHSGTHSLRMRANGAPVRFQMDGGSVHVTEGKHYRLYAWIKTDLADGQAVLKAHEGLFSYEPVTAAHEALPVMGKTDWHEISVDFTPGEKAHIVNLFVEVTGHGTVWVDDLLLQELRE